MKREAFYIPTGVTEQLKDLNKLLAQGWTVEQVHLSQTSGWLVVAKEPSEPLPGATTSTHESPAKF